MRKIVCVLLLLFITGSRVHAGEGERELVKTIDVPAFYAIGKLGSGSGSNAVEWVTPLWHSVEAGFLEVEPHIRRNDAGGFAGVWAIMSDFAHTYAPWDKETGGLYLASFEARDDSPAPEGWTKWRVPGFRYLVVQTSSHSYQQTFADTLDSFFINGPYTLAGAVHEHYPNPADVSSLELYFPIARLDEPKK